MQLQQVLLNLLLNALDAVNDNPPAKRLVAMRVRPSETAVAVTVSDNGHGIPPDKLSRVFEPFFTSKPNGLGMGLTISRSIIETHAGRLWAENRPAGGAAFTFTLPVISGTGNRTMKPLPTGCSSPRPATCHPPPAPRPFPLFGWWTTTPLF